MITLYISVPFSTIQTSKEFIFDKRLWIKKNDTTAMRIKNGDEETERTFGSEEGVIVVRGLPRNAESMMEKVKDKERFYCDGVWYERLSKSSVMLVNGPNSTKA